MLKQWEIPVVFNAQSAAVEIIKYGVDLMRANLPGSQVLFSNDGTLDNTSEMTLNGVSRAVCANRIQERGKIEGIGSRRFGRDEPGAFVAAVKSLIACPPNGTSNTATDELVRKYPLVFDRLIQQGPGSADFGMERGDGYQNNSFQIKRYPEEFINDESDPSYHKYGVLTYFGEANELFTEKFLYEDILLKKYSFPGFKFAPVVANFSQKSQVWAVSLPDVVWDKDKLNDSANYTFAVGIIEQAKVPNGVVNITTDDHWVYPGTVRRTVINRAEKLFIYTNGTGLNVAQNLGGRAPHDSFNPFNILKGRAGKFGADSNDLYGAMAFRALDRQAFIYITKFFSALKK